MRQITVLFILLITRLFSQAQSNGKALEITHLTGDFYIYTTYNDYRGSKVSANGTYLVTDDGVAMFDTPWDTTQFQPLLDSIQQRHNKPVVMCIATHFHEDRTGGLEYYNRQGIKTFTTVLTDELSQKNNHKRAKFLIVNDTVFNLGNYKFETFYPGQGHSPDNIVIWFEDQRILHGACLIKSIYDKTLGYLGDANKTDYAATIRKVMAKYINPSYVITGHGDWTHVRALKHTLAMAEKLHRKSSR